MPADDPSVLATAKIEGETVWKWILHKEPDGRLYWYLNNGHKTRLHGASFTEAEQALRQHVARTIRGELLIFLGSPKAHSVSTRRRRAAG